METTTILKCPNCGEIIEEADVLSTRLYECGECGDTFNREANNGSRCPSCSKFAGRIDSGGKGDANVCPHCETVELEESDAYQCPWCDEAFESDAFRDHAIGNHADELYDVWAEENGID